MATEEYDRKDDGLYAAISEIGNRVRYIQRETGELSGRVDDCYRLLREIWEETAARVNGTSWYDFLEDEGYEDFD